MQAPVFDHYAFEGKRPKAVSSETRIAFSDFVRMSVHRRSRATARKLPIPEWVNNDERFREVLLCYAERRLHIAVPEDAATDERLFAIKEKSLRMAKMLAPSLDGMIERIECDAPDKPLEREVQNFDRQIFMLRRGLLGVVASVAYQSWRLGFDSCEVSENLMLTPPGVRQLLSRLRRAAKIVDGEVVVRKYVGRSQWSAERAAQSRRYRLRELAKRKASEEEKLEMQQERARKLRKRHPGRRGRPSLPPEQRVQRRRECRKKYYRENRERILASQRAARGAKRPKRTAEEKAARVRFMRNKWMAAHREEQRAYFARYRATHREQIRANARKHYRRKRSLSRVATVGRGETGGLQIAGTVAAEQNFAAGHFRFTPQPADQPVVR